jgi:hypothetical protein
VAEWAVEVLNDVVEAELLSLPKDMQARFLRIAELLESFGPQRVGLPHARPLVKSCGRCACAVKMELAVSFTRRRPAGG